MFASLVSEKLQQWKGNGMKRKMPTAELAPTAEQKAMLAALDEQPDLTEFPEAPAANWQSARRYWKVRKEPISIRLDADVLDWLRNRQPKYQVEINRILRESMEAEIGRPR